MVSYRRSRRNTEQRDTPNEFTRGREREREGKKKKKDAHIAHGNHADGLPDTEADARRHAAVQAPEAVGLVDVAERVPDRHLLGPVGVLRLALHLDADDLDGLVPGAEPAAQAAGQDLLGGPQIVAVGLARGAADALLGEA